MRNESVNYRRATVADAHELAVMNHSLIRDEGHRNRMTVEELTARMSGFLADEYRAVVFELDGAVAGYVLYKLEPDWVYLRQFYVKPEYRRQGIGKAAIAWLRANAWNGKSRIRLDVLVGNSAGIAFWRSVGFADYCLTMELDQS